MISFERSCYMIPFLWTGYGLRFFIAKVNKLAVAGLLLSYGVMYYFWDIRYSVYVTPFHIWDADMKTFLVMLFRFTIGVVGGIGFIGLLRFLIDTERIARDHAVHLVYKDRGGIIIDEYLQFNSFTRVTVSFL